MSITHPKDIAEALAAGTKWMDIYETGSMPPRFRTAWEYALKHGRMVDARPVADAARAASGVVEYDIKTSGIRFDPAFWSPHPSIAGAFQAEDIGLASEPRIGMFGIWLLDGYMAALVREHDGAIDEPLLEASEDAYVVDIVLLSQPDTPGGPRAVMVSPVSASIFLLGDGEWVVGMDKWSGVLPSVDEALSLPSDGLVGASYWMGLHAAANVAASMVMVASCLAQADPSVTRTAKVPPAAVKAARAKGRSVARATTTIALPGLRYTGGRYIGTHPSTGKAWHLVRGHWRTLRAARYGEKRGTRVWVSPHARGHVDYGVSARGYKVS